MLGKATNNKTARYAKNKSETTNLSQSSFSEQLHLTSVKAFTSDHRLCSRLEVPLWCSTGPRSEWMRLGGILLYQLALVHDQTNGIPRP